MTMTDEPAAKSVAGVDAACILAAIRRKYSGCAVVHEVVVSDNGEGRYEKVGDQYKRVTNCRRIDALMFQSFERTAIEIKTTVADFKRDTWAKREPWRRITHRFIYVVPAGLPVMAPHGCGQWEVHEDGHITVKKKAIVNKFPEHLPQQIIQALAYRAAGLKQKETDQ